MTTLTAAFKLTAAVNQGARRIVGTVVPYGEEGAPGLHGSGVRLVIEAGGLEYDNDALPVLRSTHHTEPIGRAVTLDSSDTGLVAAFKVANTTAGTDALTLAAEGLQTGLSIEAEAPDGLTADDDGVYRITADNPARLTAVALVESPAFASAQVTQVAASKEKKMTDSVETPPVADPVTIDAQAITDAVSAGVTAALDNRPAELGERLTASGTVEREPFPYGFDGSEGKSLFKDLLDAQINRDSAAAIRANKAQAMMDEIAKPRGPALTGANEHVLRSTLIVPNVYDVSRYVEELVNPRVIADHVPGVAISAPNPIVIPAFSSSAADGGSGEPVIVSTEGTAPAQAELATTSITVTPLLYHGLYDVSRQAVDAAAPGTDALILRTLVNSYNEVTESAAVTAILANGTAGTDVVSDASTTAVEPQSAQKAIRFEMANMNAGLLQAPDAILFAPDVYKIAVQADNAAGSGPLYPFLSDRFTATNQAANIDRDMALAVYGRPGYLAHKLTATKFVVVNWSGVIRYESPTQTFTLNEVVAPNAVRFALAGYFVQRTLQAQAVRYFAQA